MNLDNFSWDKYDIEFKAKRKVNNKSSKTVPHIIGTFYSNKMNRSIEYESINEFILYTILELDRKTLRYYVQPIEIDIKYNDKNGIEKKWIHVPDVLVFRESMRPILYQVKESKSKITDKTRIINKNCFKYSKKKGWDYNIIYPKLLPIELINNVRFLIGFMKQRYEYINLIPSLLAKLESMKDTTVNELLNSFSGEIDRLILLPLVYHLIATGSIFTDIETPISEFSNISFYRKIDYFSYLKEVTNNEN